MVRVRTPGLPPKKQKETYFIAALDKQGRTKFIKIGVTARGRTRRRRLRELQTGSPFKLEILAIYDRGDIEKKVHRAFAKHRVRKGSEYFRPAKPLMRAIANMKELQDALAKVDENQI